MTEPSPISTSKRAAQGRATRDQLIEVATRLFAERGYEDTSIEAVLSAAGVSRGALYHHFAGKDALFEAVVASVEQRMQHRDGGGDRRRAGPDSRRSAPARWRG